MKTINTHQRNVRPLLISVGLVALTLSAFAVMGAASSSNISITVQNNSVRPISRLYLAAASDPNNWGPDQLNGSTIAPGGSLTVNAACSGSGVRVIAEDQNGCFVYENASCDGNKTWEITNSATPDCGGQ